MVDVPPIQIISPTFGDKGFLVECLDLECGFNDIASTDEDAIEMKNNHVQWHADGMPQ